jgi:hypothetical protein
MHNDALNRFSVSECVSETLASLQAVWIVIPLGVGIFIRHESAGIRKILGAVCCMAAGIVLGLAGVEERGSCLWRLRALIYLNGCAHIGRLWPRRWDFKQCEW